MLLDNLLKSSSNCYSFLQKVGGISGLRKKNSKKTANTEDYPAAAGSGSRGHTAAYLAH
ncbi:hypothetical protein ES708_19241 [subsurface metagenome]